jgi:hypothetical protein
MVYARGPNYALAGSESRRFVADRNEAFTRYAKHIDFEGRRVLIDCRIGHELQIRNGDSRALQQDSTGYACCPLARERLPVWPWHLFDHYHASSMRSAGYILTPWPTPCERPGELQ